MKKYLVLGVLFVLPIVAYVFFASGVNNFGKLPTLRESVLAEVSLLDENGSEVSFKDHISILGFLGDDLEHKKTNAFNLNQKIYKRFNGFTDFQFVMVLPENTKSQVAALKQELSPLADISNWKFVFLPTDQVADMYNKLNIPGALNDDVYIDRVYIIDRDGSLRGRSDDEDMGLLFGYDATSVAEINNKMVDDVKIILAEYRLALKKNNKSGTSQRDSYLKKLQHEK
ncbi:hypothetical protein [Robertkochia solimangrovi]|uniref:hypothetical protein n=1 Tax=Robertkochia solimangrovi TaxID=2213046 RepID=UPI00117F970B|nr:hypothetical protein [Robertkochia solimangrovi]TRZ45775.1 hypothetical protein DMZ48_00410 [Robertkochia solimangrovi]